MKPKKSLGQHFLQDKNIILKIIEAIPYKDPSDLVVEIGPGTGSMTELLLDKFENFMAVEIDQRAVRMLEEKFPSLTVIHGDILKISWDKILEYNGNIHIVGNLPYYITSQILFVILENRQHLYSALLMMQKEVAARLVAEPRTKAYGILSVQVQLMSSPEILFDVSPHVFYPPPEVTSSVVGLKFDQSPLACSDQNLKTVVRTAFQQRRKKLSNSLKRFEPLPEDPAFDYDARAEAWLPRTYEKLTARLEQLGTLS
ncbi:MAG: 16S rRNA (adenine(1518)-N(6)/adenine(1519)-N(6))-dimethyltransferase RsmA [Balneolaceae bacterium]